MSKQYLTSKIVEDAHTSSIFAVAVTSTYALTGSGSSSIKLHTLADPEHPLAHTFEGAHKFGCHHLATSKDDKSAASVGYEGSVKIWDLESLELKLEIPQKRGRDVEQSWAVALSSEGAYCAISTQSGKIVVWNLTKEEGPEVLQTYETKGNFAMCVDMSTNGKHTASGHENGGIYIFNNETRKLLHSLAGIVKPVRVVSFSPGGRLLAACGDFEGIVLYDIISGEQIGSFTGHGSWVFALSWNETGQLLVSSAFDGKAKVWSIDQKACLATLSESSTPLFGVKFLPKIGPSEGFVTVGKTITFYREASGGGGS